MTSSRRLLNFILCFSLVLAPTTPVYAAKGLELATAENAFLRDLAERTKLFIHMNWANINGTYMCLTDSSADPVQCRDRLTHVRSEIALNYPKLRQHQILFHLFDKPNSHNLMLRLYNAVAKKAAGEADPYSWKLKNMIVEHPLDYILHSEDLPNAPFTQNEIESGLNGLISQGQEDLKGFNFYFQKLCAEVFTQHGYKKTLPLFIDLCQKIELKLDVKNQSLNFSLPNELPAGSREEFAVLNGMATGRLETLAKSFRTKFLGMVQIVPYVGLVNSANPTPTDLAHAFKTMLEPARKVITEFDDRAAMYAQVPPSQERSSPHRWKWINLMGYKPIAKHLVANPGRNMNLMPSYGFEELREELDSEYETNQLIKMGAQLTFVLAANVVVCWKGGKFLGLVAKRAARFIPAVQGLCYPMVTIPINIGFMIETTHDFSVKYQEVFASQSGQQLLREISTLDDEEVFVVIGALMMPLGTGKALKYLGSKAIKLSKRSLDYLTQMIPKVQATP